MDRGVAAKQCGPLMLSLTLGNGVARTLLAECGCARWQMRLALRRQGQTLTQDSWGVRRQLGETLCSRLSQPRGQRLCRVLGRNVRLRLSTPTQMMLTFQCS